MSRWSLLLLDKGADVNAVDSFGKTAFLHASSRGRTETARLLSDRGAAASTGPDSYTAVMDTLDKDKSARKVAEEKFPDRVREVKTRSNTMGNALIDAARNNDSETVKLLLEKGADVNARNNSGETPLIVCRKKELAQFLIEKGADAKAQTDDGRTALMTQIKDTGNSQASPGQGR